MGAEGSISSNQESITQSEGLVVKEYPFISSNFIIAGKIKVKHPLMENELLVVGFVRDQSGFNQLEFEIRGIKIQFYGWANGKKFVNVEANIYPKIIIDKKMNHFSKYFGEDGIAILFNENIDKRVKKVEDVYVQLYHNSDGVYRDYKGEKEFNYYLYSDLFSNTPCCATNQNIYAICKYRENGDFKHAIFSFNELDPVKEQ